MNRTPVQPEATPSLEHRFADACTHPCPRLRWAFASLDGPLDLIAALARATRGEGDSDT